MVLCIRLRFSIDFSERVTSKGFLKTVQSVRYGVVGNISACHADARGSIPRFGVLFFYIFFYFFKKIKIKIFLLGFEPARAEHSSLAGCRLNHSAKVSLCIDSATGNRTPGICVTGRDVTNYTISDNYWLLLINRLIRPICNNRY